MLGSVGCPYTCSFCIDSVVPYQALDFQTIKSDLRFLLTKFKKPLVGWHDPNFGIRFDENMDAIASAAPLKSFRFARRKQFVDFDGESPESITTKWFCRGATGY